MKKLIKETLQKFPRLYFFIKNYILHPLRYSKERVYFEIEKKKRTYVLKQMAAIKKVFNLSVLSNLTLQKDDIIVTLRDGRKFFWYPEESNSLFTIPREGIYEPEETEVLKHLISKDDIVFDIGANFGYYTILMLRQIWGGGGGVHSFEPLPETFLKLKKNIALNGFADNISLNNVALGERNGELTIRYPKRFGSGLATFSDPYNDLLSKRVCSITTLDNYISEKNIKNISFIKCDVEGYELFVLKGFQLLSKLELLPIWLLETQWVTTKGLGYHPKDIFSYLKKFGYCFYYCFQKKIYLLRDFENLPGYNFFCLNPTVHFKLAKLAGFPQF